MRAVRRTPEKVVRPYYKSVRPRVLKFKQICLQIVHLIKYLLTKLGRARSVRHDLEPNIFPSGPPT